jgi:methylated-DNA-protein-cysteine methyltransferase-like protein
MKTQSTAEDNHQRIWQVVASIPPGKVASYSQVATLAGLPRGARLVGRTLGALPLDSKLPWYRVIRADGKLAFPEGSDRYQRQRDRLAQDGVVLLKAKVSRALFQW